MSKEYGDTRYKESDALLKLKRLRHFQEQRRREREFSGPRGREAVRDVGGGVLRPARLREGRPVVAQPRRRGRGQQRGNGDDDAGGRGDVGAETG